MSRDEHHGSVGQLHDVDLGHSVGNVSRTTVKSERSWRNYLARRQRGKYQSSTSSLTEEKQSRPEKWSLGILNDKKTEEVPGTVLLLSANRNEPLGMQHATEETSSSSLPSPYPTRSRSSSQSESRTVQQEKKKTADGKLILEPQPDDSLNDPLNWPAWRRDAALLSLGFYCMLGGGMTPILAAGFNDVASTFGVTYQQVALTTGLYMMGLGIGSVLFSPTAILFGKRPVYLVSAIIFALTGVWCALSPNFGSLIAARIIQGIVVSPVECLPSATIAEIFFLHERAFRIGIYTLLLLGGKNLVPLVSAAIIQSLEWRWVFWVVALISGFGFCLLFLFVPETFWDRTPRPKSRTRRPSFSTRQLSDILRHPLRHEKSNLDLHQVPSHEVREAILTPRQQRLHGQNAHVGFIEEEEEGYVEKSQTDSTRDRPQMRLNLSPASHSAADRITPNGNATQTPLLHNLNSPFYVNIEKKGDYLSHRPLPAASEQQLVADVGHMPMSARLPKIPPMPNPHSTPPRSSINEALPPTPKIETQDAELGLSAVKRSESIDAQPPSLLRYTTNLKHQPLKTFTQCLNPWNGRLSQANWFKVALRPFILFAYPSVLWSTMVYSLSVGWLIVLSESVSNIYRSRNTYNFSALGVGLVYVSPFVGGVLGTAVAGKVSDIIVRYMSKRNGGVYEPEFRLVMAAPVLLTTATGLMGFGWSAQEHDKWIVPTVFFGVISFGCSLGSTTAITFCVDSYRQYAGEALVTLNFSKNVFHGLVFSLFFPHWLEAEGPKNVFLAIGGIQIACLLTTIPMYVYGKRARMWTVRKKFMEKF